MSAQQVEFKIEGGLQQQVHPLKAETPILLDNVVYRFAGSLSPRDRAVVVTRSPTTQWIGDTLTSFPGIANNTTPGWTGIVSTDADPLFFTSQYAWQAVTFTGTGPTAFSFVGTCSTVTCKTEDAFGGVSPVYDASSAINQDGTLIAECWTQFKYDTSQYVGLVNIRYAATGEYLVRDRQITFLASPNKMLRLKPAWAGSNLFVLFNQNTQVNLGRFDCTVPSAVTYTNTFVDNTQPGTTSGMDCQPLGTAGTHVIITYVTSAAASARKIAAWNSAGLVGQLTTWAGDASVTPSWCFSIDASTQSDVLVAYGTSPNAVGPQNVLVRGVRFNFANPAAPAQIANVFTIHSTAASPVGVTAFIYQVSIRRYSATRAKCVFSFASGPAVAGQDVTTLLYEVEPNTPASTQIGNLEHYSIESQLFANPEAGRFAEASGYEPASHMFVARPASRVGAAAVGNITSLGTGVVFSTEKACGITSVSATHVPRQEARFGVGQVAALVDSTAVISFSSPVGINQHAPLNADPSFRCLSSLSNVHVGFGSNTISTMILKKDTGYTPNVASWLNIARINGLRQSATIGRRTIVTGGVPMFWDGKRLFEVGFTTYPNVTATAIAGGAQAVGSYMVSGNFEYVDALGDRHTSPSSPSWTGTVIGVANAQFQLNSIGLPAHYVPDSSMDNRNGPFIQYYRTIANSSGPKYKVAGTSSFPITYSSTFVTNTTDNFTLSTTNATAIQEVSDGRLDSIGPPSATMCTVWNSRFVLAGTDDDSIWFSSEQEDGIAPFFNEGFRIVIPFGGRITGVCGMDDKLIVFKRETTFVVYGTPPDNTGSGGNLVVQQISGQVGCLEQESVQLGKDGVYFRSVRGIHRVSRGLSLEFVGERVITETYNTAIPISDTVTETINGLILFFFQPQGGNGLGLIYDERNDCWTRITGNPVEYTARRANGQITAVAQSGLWVVQQQGDTSGRGFAIQTGWKQIEGPQGEYVVRRVGILGDQIGSHVLQAEVFANYNNVTPVATFTFDTASLTGMGYQWIMSGAGGTSPAHIRQISVRLTLSAGSYGAASNSARIASVNLEYERVSGKQQRLTADGQRG